MIFHNAQQTTPPQHVIDAVYNLLPGNLDRAKEVLKAYGRSWDHPLWGSSKEHNAHMGAYSFITEACNVLNCMEMRTFDGSINGGVWGKVEKMPNQKYVGWVMIS